MKKTNFFMIIMGVALVGTALLLTNLRYQELLKQKDSQLAAVRSEATIYRNKYNESVVERESFVGGQSDLKEEVKLWASQGDSLRSKVSSSTKQITLLKQKLTFTASGRPQVVYSSPSDTAVFHLNQGSIAIDTVNRWVEAHIQVSPNRYDLDFKVKELDLEFLVENKRNGLFGRKYTNVKAISHNPYVDSRDVKTITMHDRKQLVPKFAIAIAGFIAGAFL